VNVANGAKASDGQEQSPDWELIRRRALILYYHDPFHHKLAMVLFFTSDGIYTPVSAYVFFFESQNASQHTLQP